MVLVNDLYLGAVFPGGKLAEEETKVRDGKAGSQRPSFPGDQPGQFPQAVSVTGGSISSSIDTPSSLSPFSSFHRDLLSTSLPPCPPGSSPALAAMLRTGLGAKPGSAPALEGRREQETETRVIIYEHHNYCHCCGYPTASFTSPWMSKGISNLV